MVREYVGQVTINGRRHELRDMSREGVAAALRLVTETAEALGWEISNTAIMTKTHSSITGSYMGRRACTRLNPAGLEVVI